MRVVGQFSARYGGVEYARPKSIHFDRAVGGHSDYIALDVYTAAGAEQGEGPGQVGDLPQQHAADRPGGEHLCGGYDGRYVEIPLRAVGGI